MLIWLSCGTCAYSVCDGACVYGTVHTQPPPSADADCVGFNSFLIFMFFFFYLFLLLLLLSIIGRACAHIGFVSIVCRFSISIFIGIIKIEEQPHLLAKLSIKPPLCERAQLSASRGSLRSYVCVCVCCEFNGRFGAHFCLTIAQMHQPPIFVLFFMYVHQWVSTVSAYIT